MTTDSNLQLSSGHRQCWTTAPNNLSQLFMQQLRWRRSGLRDLFWTIRNFKENVEKLHVFAIINYLLPGALTLLWPFMYIYAMFNGWTTEHLLADLQIYFGLYITVGMAFNWYAHHSNPEQKINPLAVSVLGVWFIIDSFFTTVLALCTFDIGKWGTRGTSQRKA